MSLVIENMPDDPPSLARWLDEQLVGDRLGELVAELAGAGAEPTGRQTLSGLLGDTLPAVMQRGLAAASPELVRGLLRQPRALLELQERVFLAGGPYWRNLPRPAALTSRAEQIWSRMEPVGSNPPADARPSVGSSTTEWLRWGVSLATAATVMAILFGAWQVWGPKSNVPAVATWGWTRGLPDETDATRYLDRLAAQAEEWKDARPATPAALVQRLGEFRQGCGLLLISTHPQLNDAQRRDLWESCRKWSGTLDELIMRTQQGEDVETIRGEADALVAKLAAALRGRIAERKV